MLVRLLIVLAVLAAAAVALRMWRLPPSVRRLDLPDLAIDGPAIVQFTTPWCGPCKAAAPQLRRVAEASGVAYAEVDVAARPEIARRYGIRRVPTVAVAGASGRVLGVWTALPAIGELAEAARAAAS